MNKYALHFAMTAMLCACGWICANASEVTADTEPATSTSAAGPEESQLGEILVTAQRKSERLRDVPISVTAVTGEQLAQDGITDTRGLEQVAPGLNFTSQGAWAEPNIRGVSTGNSGPGEESPIAIYVDGVYQVSQVASLFDLPDIAQIEVLKGPQGTLFGRNAEGGAIQIRTKDPTFTPTGDLTASYGYYTGNGGSHSSPEYKTQVFVGGPVISDTVAASFSSYTRSTDGYLNNIDSDTRDGSINTQVFRSKLLVVPFDSAKLLFAGWYSENRDNADAAATAPNGASILAATNPTTGLPNYPGAIVATEPWTTAHTFPEYIHTRTWGASAKADFEFEPGTLTSLTAYNYAQNDVRVSVEGGYLPPGAVRTGCYELFACIDYDATQPAESASQELTWVSHIKGPFSYVAGLFAFRSDEHQTGYINQDVLPTAYHNDNRVVDKTYAGFAELNYAATDALTFIAGGRYSHEEKIGSYAAVYDQGYVATSSPNWNSFTPRASVKYALDATSNVYFTFSEGFKSGVINLSPPFDVVAPEKLKAYEFGYKADFDRYSIEASTFYYDYRDIQVQTWDKTFGVTTNAAVARVFGLDIDNRVRPISNLELRLAASYLPIAKYISYPSISYYTYPIGPFGFTTATGSASGNRLLKTPDLTATVAATYSMSYSWGTLAANASVYYTDSFFWELGYRVRTPAHQITNAQLAATPRGTNLKLALFVKNLTNAAYVQGVVEGGTTDTSTYGPPREIGVSAEYSF
jgi:iron complex outermembrane receptor protein